MLIGQPLNIGNVGELNPWSHHRVGSDCKSMPLFVGIWVLRPCPGWEEYVDTARFHVPRRQGKDQRTGPLDLAARHRHQMIGYTVDMRIRLKVLRLACVVPRRFTNSPRELF